MTITVDQIGAVDNRRQKTERRGFGSYFSGIKNLADKAVSAYRTFTGYDQKQSITQTANQDFKDYASGKISQLADAAVEFGAIKNSDPKFGEFREALAEDFNYALESKDNYNRLVAQLIEANTPEALYAIDTLAEISRERSQRASSVEKELSKTGIEAQSRYLSGIISGLSQKAAGALKSYFQPIPDGELSDNKEFSNYAKIQIDNLFNTTHIDRTSEGGKLILRELTGALKNDLAYQRFLGRKDVNTAVLQAASYLQDKKKEIETRLRTAQNAHRQQDNVVNLDDHRKPEERSLGHRWASTASVMAIGIGLVGLVTYSTPAQTPHAQGKDRGKPSASPSPYKTQTPRPRSSPAPANNNTQPRTEAQTLLEASKINRESARDRLEAARIENNTAKIYEKIGSRTYSRDPFVYKQELGTKNREQRRAEQKEQKRADKKAKKKKDKESRMVISHDKYGNLHASEGKWPTYDRLAKGAKLILANGYVAVSIPVKTGGGIYRNVYDSSGALIGTTGGFDLGEPTVSLPWVHVGCR